MKWKTTLLMLILPCVTHAASIFWLHHSTGRNLIDEGSIRQQLGAHELWDHDFNLWCGSVTGLRSPNGTYLGYDYDIPGDDNCGDTDPVGLHYLLCTPSEARNLCLQRDVAVFKSCYSASDISSDAQLDRYKAFYSDISSTLQALESQTRTCVLMTPPPRHRLATSTDAGARVREFANWMVGTLAGGRIVVYDLFDELAGDDNFLKYEYERWHSFDDSHPNTLANQIVGASVAAALIAAADTETSISEAMPARDTWGSIKATYLHRKD